MTFSYLSLLLLAVSVLLTILLVARRRRTQITSSAALLGVIHPVDIEAFCNLVDPEEDAYLRSLLPAGQYRHLRRERLLAGVLYVRTVSANAVALLALGEAVRRNPDPRVAAVGEQMVNSAIRLRLFAAVVLLNLWAAVALPKTKVPSAALVSRYRYLKELASHLSRLENPILAGRVTASL